MGEYAERYPHSPETRLGDLVLAELRPLVGQTVEIVISPEPIPQFVPGTGDWSAMERCVGDLKDYDFDAWRQQRELDLQHADRHAP